MLQPTSTTRPERRCRAKVATYRSHLEWNAGLGRSFSPKLLMVVVLIERAVGEEECVHGSMIQEKDRFACQEYYVDRYKAALPEATAAGSCSQPR